MSAELVEALAAVRDRTAGLRLGLEAPGADAARQVAATLVGQADDYLLPRLRQLDAPLLAVVGGSTGAGKSTLVNTLVGAEVSPPGVLRPTTRSPVLVCHPEDVRWFASTRILPGLARTTGLASQPDPGGRTVRLVTHDAVPPGLALLDAPDVDSVVTENRELARQLLAAADLWLFVTTAARYADAVPWDLLRTAEERGTALAVVLNRVPPEGVEKIAGHLTAMLADGGLSRTTLFTLPELPAGADLAPGGALTPVVAPLRAWLDRLGRDAAARTDLIRSTLDGALRSLAHRVSTLAGHVDTQRATADALRREADDRYAAARRDVEDGMRAGSVLRGEVLARWHEFVGTGELTRTLEARVGWLRDRLTAFFTGRPLPDAAVEKAVESSLESLVRAAADRAAAGTVDGWRSRPAGVALLGGKDRELAHSSPQFRPALEHEIRAWQGRLLKLVAEQGGRKRTSARLASLSVNGAGLVLMLAVFAQTGGLTGAEVLIAGGTSAVSHKLLEAVFGDTAVRALAAQARADLLERVDALLATERKRYATLIASAAPPPSAAADLRTALTTFERAHRAFRSRPGTSR